MKRIAIAAAGLMALALSATVSSAAPLSGLGSQAAGVEASIVKVHGVHRSCRLGRPTNNRLVGHIHCLADLIKHGADILGRGDRIQRSATRRIVCNDRDRQRAIEVAPGSPGTGVLES